MQRQKAIKLFFKGPLHLAKGKNDYDKGERTLHSDMIKSALLASALSLNDQIDTIKFLGGFRISSAFPFYHQEYFFPKPFAPIQEIEGVDESVMPKKLKKILYLGKSYFEDLLQGSKDKIKTHHLAQNGELVSRFTETWESTEIFKTDVQQRVAIPDPNNNENPDPYYVERLWFNDGAGLFFLLNTADEMFRDMLLPALRLLSDTGIGTDKNIGNGHFDFEVIDFELDLPASPDSQMILGLYCPSWEETQLLDLNHSNYQLIKRGGFLASPGDWDHLTIRKKSIHMFQVGSIFPATSGLSGKLIDLRPELPGGMKQVDHPVYRDGRPMFLPFKSKV